MLAGMTYNKGETPQSISTTQRRKKGSVTDMEEMEQNRRRLERTRMEYERAQAEFQANLKEFGRNFNLIIFFVHPF
jgi:hypothetical protein